VADTVVGFLRHALGDCPAGPRAWDRLRDAVTVALELAAQLADHGALSIRAMRSDARPAARLSCRLVEEFGDRSAARSLARLLVGGDGSSVETALLWWVAYRSSGAADVPEPVRLRWLRDLLDADPSVVTRRTRRRQARERRAERTRTVEWIRQPMAQCVRIRPGVS
jgi:hypothetical protein